MVCSLLEGDANVASSSVGPPYVSSLVSGAMCNPNLGFLPGVRLAGGVGVGEGPLNSLEMGSLSAGPLAPAGFPGFNLGPMGRLEPLVVIVGAVEEEVAWKQEELMRRQQRNSDNKGSNLNR